MTPLTHRNGEGCDLIGCRRSVVDEARGRLEVPVQHEGIEVGSVGPDDGAQLVVHSHLREVVRIGQRLEHRAMQLVREIDVARAAVAKAKPELVVTQHIHRGDAYELHTPILRQRVDGFRRAPVLCPLPICFQLFSVKAGPLRHELERATRQTTHKQVIVADHDRRVVLGIFGVEVGRIVIVEYMVITMP